MGSKNQIRTLICGAMLALPLSLQAADCDTLFGTLPDHSKDTSDEAKQMQSVSEDCDKKFPSEKDKANPKADECFGQGMTDLANKGNYLAATAVAENACHENKMDDSKKWLNAVVNNAKAPKDDKDKAAQIVKNLGK